MSAGSQFIQLPLEVLTDSRLSAGAKLFLAHLLRWDWGNGCWLTDKQLACELGVSVRSVRNHTNALEKAGRLWVFDDREGMTVRLVVRPGRVYPRPRGFGAPRPQKEFSTPSRARKDFNYTKPDFEVHQTTTDHLPTPVLKKPVDQEMVETVVTKEPQNLTEEPPIEAPETDSEPMGKDAVLKPANPSIEVLQDVGVSAPVAQILARRHSAGRIRATVAYTQSYRGELLNKPGYVVAALQNGWKLPKWCYRPELAKTEVQKQPSWGQSQCDPACGLPSMLAFNQVCRSSPHAKAWRSALSAMRNPAHLNAWVPPNTAAMLAESIYIAGITSEACTLAAASPYVAATARSHMDQIQESLRLVGLDCERVIVEEQP